MQTSNNIESGERIISSSMGTQQNLMNQINQSASQPYVYNPSAGNITSAPSTTATGYYPSSYTQQYTPPVKRETYTSPLPSVSAQDPSTPNEAEEDEDDDDEDDDMADHNTANPIQQSAASTQYASAYTQNTMQPSAAMQPSQSIVSQPQHRPATKTERQWLRASGYELNPATNGTGIRKPRNLWFRSS